MSTSFYSRGSLLLLAASLVMVGSSHAVVLVSDTFTTGAAGGFNGRTPETTFGERNWIAPSNGTLQLNGAGGVSATYSTSWAGFDLGEGYISSNPGIYELKVTISNVNASDNTSWLGMGFAASIATNSNFVAGEGQPWLLQRTNGLTNVYAGPNITNQVINGSTIAPAGVAQTYYLTLDATNPADIIFSARVDLASGGTHVFDLNGAAPGTSNNPVTNPTIRYVGISGTFNGSSPGVGTFDNFELSFTPIPEPSSLLLGLLAAPGLLIRRRR